MPHLNFRDLYFGFASAEAEVAYDPSRFLDRFYDRWNIASALRDDSFFLVVGPKGSGKTAISEFIRLHSERRYGQAHVFSHSLNLDDVTPGVSPLSAISQKLVSEQATGITDSAWRLYISIRFFELLMQDASCSVGRDPLAVGLAKQLSDVGLMASDFPTVLRKVRENKFSISLKGFVGGEHTTKVSDQVPVSKLGEALQRIIVDAESDNQFILSIDGLDRIIGDNRAYWLTLAALLRVGDDYHLKLRRARSSIRILVMCRSDVFRKIRFADADKISGDSTLFVDWGAQQTVPRDSPLWDYLAAKATISPEALLSLFPGFIEVGLRSKDKVRRFASAEYLLTSTRSTPREMTMLMKRLQSEVPPKGLVTSDRVRSAVDYFASRDLLTTVAAECTGILEDAISDRLEDILSGFEAASNVGPEDIRRAMSAAGVDESLAGDFAEFLFLAGLLGNYDPQTGYIQFYHRRDTYKFKRSGPWQLHRGLMYAFNIPFSRRAASLDH